MSKKAPEEGVRSQTPKRHSDLDGLQLPGFLYAVKHQKIKGKDHSSPLTLCLILQWSVVNGP